MGRVKVKIQRLETMSNRQVTYSKRKTGMLKKAEEISVLCDIDIALVTFSPTGKPTLFSGGSSTFLEIISKFAQLSPQEMAKRKFESLEALKKTFKKLDHDVDMKEFLDTSTPSIEETCNQVKMLQAKVIEVRKRLSLWTNQDEVEDMERLSKMEDSLKDSLNRINSLKKEHFQKHQVVPFDCSSQRGMHLPLMMSGDQEGCTLPWILNNECQNMILPKDPNFPPQRDMGCPVDVAVPRCSGSFGIERITKIDREGKVDNTRQEGSSMDDMHNTASITLQHNMQYLYRPYGGINSTEMRILDPESEVNFQENHMNYLGSGPVYNIEHHTSNPESGACSISMFNKSSYTQSADHL